VPLMLCQPVGLALSVWRLAARTHHHTTTHTRVLSFAVVPG
jgi:hypothetical protein